MTQPPQHTVQWPPEVQALWDRVLSSPDRRRFQLVRHHDVTGVSGEGVVADGVAAPDGLTLLRWRGDRPSSVVWLSTGDAMAVHGHDGATTIEWLDQENR